MNVIEVSNQMSGISWLFAFHLESTGVRPLRQTGLHADRRRIKLTPPTSVTAFWHDHLENELHDRGSGGSIYLLNQNEAVSLSRTDPFWTGHARGEGGDEGGYPAARL